VTTDSNTNAARETKSDGKQCLDTALAFSMAENSTVSDARIYVQKLQRFKDWVHAYLDAQGVPHHPPGTHGAEGCRIGDRMDWLMDRLRKAEAQQAEQGDGGVNEAVSKVRAARERVADRMTDGCKCDECNYVRVVDELLAALTQPPRQSEDGRLRWISVKERLPDIATDVLGFFGASNIVVCGRDHHGLWCENGEDVATPEYWMPLPEPPAPAAKGEERGR
jgi:hypothetical protein